MTPKRDALAVVRVMNAIDKRRAEIAELERALPGHANRLCDALGYRVMLRGDALRRAAEQVAA